MLLWPGRRGVWGYFLVGTGEGWRPRHTVNAMHCTLKNTQNGKFYAIYIFYFNKKNLKSTVLNSVSNGGVEVSCGMEDKIQVAFFFTNMLYLKHFLRELSILFFSYTSHSILFCISFRWTASWLDDHTLYSVSPPRYFYYPSGTVHSYHDIIDCVSYQVALLDEKTNRVDDWKFLMENV